MTYKILQVLKDPVTIVDLGNIRLYNSLFRSPSMWIDTRSLHANIDGQLENGWLTGEECDRWSLNGHPVKLDGHFYIRNSPHTDPYLVIPFHCLGTQNMLVYPEPNIVINAWPFTLTDDKLRRCYVCHQRTISHNLLLCDKCNNG